MAKIISKGYFGTLRMNTYDKVCRTQQKLQLYDTTVCTAVLCVSSIHSSTKTINMWHYCLWTGVPGENQRPAASHWQTLSHNVVSSTPRLSGIWTHKVVIGADCIGR